LLAPKSKVYKLVGPILINVDLEEAKENVGKRLEFIEAEVHKVDATIGEATQVFAHYICCTFIFCEENVSVIPICVTQYSWKAYPEF
jgi:hypothetical protein